MSISQDQTRRDLTIDPLAVESSRLLVTGFFVLPLLMIAGLGIARRSMCVVIVWVAWASVTAILALVGFFADFSTAPPYALLLPLVTFALVALAVFSPLARPLVALPTSLLVGFQSFRILVELLIHQAVAEGVAPPQMSWDGLNYDIVAGVSALLVFPFAHRVSTRTLLIWNTAGLGSLLWVVLVAVLSMPTPLQQFKPGTIWVTHFPFVWLPAILVAIALLGHLVLFRKLLASAQTHGTA